jgi:hypothetical protein
MSLPPPSSSTPSSPLCHSQTCLPNELDGCFEQRKKGHCCCYHVPFQLPWLQQPQDGKLAITMDLMVVWSKGATATADIAPLSLPSKEAKATCGGEE